MTTRLFLLGAVVLFALPLDAQDEKKAPEFVNIVEELDNAAPIWISAFDEASKPEAILVAVLNIEMPAPKKPHKRKERK